MSVAYTSRYARPWNDAPADEFVAQRYVTSFERNSLWNGRYSAKSRCCRASIATCANGHWAQVVSDHDVDLLAIGTEAGLLIDRTTSLAVAEWSYGHAERVQAEVWLGGTEYGHLSAGWRGLLPYQTAE